MAHRRRYAGAAHHRLLQAGDLRRGTQDPRDRWSGGRARRHVRVRRLPSIEMLLWLPTPMPHPVDKLGLGPTRKVLFGTVHSVPGAPFGWSAGASAVACRETF